MVEVATVGRSLSVSAGLLAGSILTLGLAAPALGRHIPAASPPAAGAAGTEPAASEPEAPHADTPPASDIVVTGTRIPQNGTNTPTPVTVVSAAQLQASAPSTIAAALNNLPSLVPIGGPNSNGGSTAVSRNNLNLRGLGITRTLTLVDGHRFPASSTNNTVDSNLIPQALISRVEVVTGGASAAYGSDAVAGVVNFILDKKFTGIAAEGGYGISQRGDGAEKRGDITAGVGFADDHGHVIVSGEYYDSDGVAGDARGFRRRGDNLIPNPAATVPPTAANPTRIAARNVRVPATFGGLVISATGGTAANNARLVGTQFLPGGVTAPFDFGTLTSSSGQSGGDGVNTAVLQPILRPLQRYTAYGRLSYDPADTVTAYTEGSYGYTRGLAPNVYYHTGANALTIRADNAFLPTALRTQIASLGITSFRLARYDGEPDSVLDAKAETWRAMGGLQGTLGRLKWDGFYQYGRTRQTVLNRGMYIIANFANAVDAVRSPTTGQIVCRSTLTSPTNGCVPYNPFGAGSPSAEAVNYVNGLNDNYTTIVDQTAGASIAGPLVRNWAGEIAFATGIDYRRVDDTVRSNSIAAMAGFFTGSIAPWSGGYTIWEGFGEVDVPLARDITLLQSLNLNAAVRYAHYSTSGGATTWKVGLTWEPVHDLKLRATRSRDIRAPNPEELFRGGSQATYTISDPFRSGATTSGVPFVTVGNRNLQPEKADTTVVGFVYQPGWFRGFDLTVDAYDIKIKDAIANLTPQDYLDRCFRGQTELCANIRRDANGVVAGGTIGPFNFVSFQARGIDVEVGYRLPGRVLGGTLAVRALGSYIDRLASTTTITVDRAGDLNSGAPTPNSVPRWRALFTANYDQPMFAAFLQLRVIGSGKLDNTYTSASSNLVHIDPQAYLDGQVTAKIDAHAELSLNIQNLLDKSPPFVPLVSNYNVPTNASLYDQVGRTFRLIGRVRF